MRQWLQIFSLFFLLIAPFTSAEEIETEIRKEHVQADIVFEEESLQPGRPFWVALRLKMEDEWHSYWKNPGDAGMAPVVEWTLPEGFSVSPFLWPTPKKFSVNATMGFGYEGEVVLLAQMTPPPTLSHQTPASIGALVRWVVCSDSTCVLGESQASAMHPITLSSPLPNAHGAQLLANARSKLPKHHEGGNAYHTQEFIKLTLQLSEKHAAEAVNPLSPLSFYPEHNDVIDSTVAPLLVAVAETPHQYELILKRASTPNSQIKTLSGVLVMGHSEDTPNALEINAPIAMRTEKELIGLAEPHPRERSSSFDVSAPEPEISGLGMALLFAFLGGMILNLMPCVLPVISFKILSFVKMAGQSRSLIFHHGLAFSAGVLFSFWILAGLLLSLQAYGHAVGWGFQLQEPIFVGILAAILFVFGLSLFGVFELGTSLTSLAGRAQTSRNEGLIGSFLSGILATAVATPCTGPFLGSAVGFAISVSPLQAMLIFTVLGIGMAFPYLVLSAYPNLLRFLPKPGLWMVIFKEAMGFFLLATVLWLVWVFAAQTDSFAVLLLLVGFFILALGGWVFGKWGSAVCSPNSRRISYVITTLCLVITGYLISTAAQTSSPPQELSVSPHSSSDWEPYSPERLAELQSQGIPVLVDFTAKWCLICQANHLVLSNAELTHKFNQLGVVKMKADWTKKDPMITKELRKHGRNSVPLYLLYGKNPAQPPQPLPQLLTTDIVLQYLEKK